MSAGEQGAAHMRSIRVACAVTHRAKKRAPARQIGKILALPELNHPVTRPMAIKSVIYKATLQVADMDRHYYADHSLNIACHPSETLQRMMVRILVFALNAHEQLEFGKGISEVDEPDIWQKDLTGAIDKWIEVGQPDERRIMKACGRASEVMVYAYGSSTDIWWKQIASKLSRAKNLSVLKITPETAEALERLCERTMQLQVTIQDGEVWMRTAGDAVEARFETLMPMP